MTSSDIIIMIITVTKALGGRGETTAEKSPPPVVRVRGITP